MPLPLTPVLSPPSCLAMTMLMRLWYSLATEWLTSCAILSWQMDSMAICSSDSCQPGGAWPDFGGVWAPPACAPMTRPSQESPIESWELSGVLLFASTTLDKHRYARQSQVSSSSSPQQWPHNGQSPHGPRVRSGPAWSSAARSGGRYSCRGGFLLCLCGRGFWLAWPGIITKFFKAIKIQNFRAWFNLQLSLFAQAYNYEHLKWVILWWGG